MCVYLFVFVSAWLCDCAYQCLWKLRQNLRVLLEMLKLVELAVCVCVYVCVAV